MGPRKEKRLAGLARKKGNGKPRSVCLISRKKREKGRSSRRQSRGVELSIRPEKRTITSRGVGI